MEPLICKHSKKRSRIAVVIFLLTLIVIQCVFWNEWYAPSSEKRSQDTLVLAVVSILFGGLLYISVRQLFVREPYLIIGEEGLRLASFRPSLLLWNQIRQISRREDVFRNSYLDMDLRSTEKGSLNDFT